MSDALPVHPSQSTPGHQKGEGGVEIFTTRLSDAVNWARKNSLWPMPMGISCCAIEMMAMVGSKHDLARFGAEVFRFSPRQADLMIVAGTLTNKMAPVVRRIYDQMPEPKWVIAMGVCLTTGGMFDSYPVVQGLDRVIPVDAYVSGCPPRPEAVIQALMQIQKKAQESRKLYPISRAMEYQPTVPMYEIETEEKPTKEKTMIINMGPQHPSTHGVLRLVLELDGEEVVKAYPHVGYLHRGYEKLGEHRTYHQYITYTDRLDYLAPLSNNVAYTLAIEKLMGIDLTPRNKMIRIVCCELARLSGHLLSLGTYAMDVGAVSVFFHTFQERENIYTLQEKLTGTRMTTSYTRVGSLARDLPEGWLDELRAFLNGCEKVIDEVDRLLSRNPIWVQRTQDVGVINREMAIEYGLTGPILRAAGVPYDIRKDKPYLGYENFDFDIPVGTTGDSYDRYMVRLMEMRESIKILRQAADQMPEGPIASNVPGVVLPEKERVYTKMEELITHFKIISEGFKPPVADVYSSVEAPKGEMGFYVVSDGGPRAWRMRIKSPSFTNIQVLSEILPGLKVADIVTTIASIDPVMGEADR